MALRKRTLRTPSRVTLRQAPESWLEGAKAGAITKPNGQAYKPSVLPPTNRRRGELLALRWGDVDWNSRRVWVRRNVTNRSVFQEPKTRGSVRAIAMLTTLATALREHQMASPFKDADDLIFSTQKGTPVDGHNFVRRVFDPALRRAGLPKIRFHDLRHTFASLLIAQGEHPKLISE